MLRVLLAKLSGQWNMPPHIGAFISAYTSAAILYAPLTFLGVVTTVYGLWGADRMREWLPWFNFWHLVGIMILLIVVAMVIFYKVVLPSIYAFQVQQQYKHRNPLVDDMKEVLGKLGGIEKKLAEANERLGKLEVKK